MRWIGWLFHPRNRRLEISTGGKWFLLFTLILGVVAINSGNNVIYLLESLLLSSILFSGVLSEFTVNRLSLERSLRQAVAGDSTADLLLLKNRSWLPLYCVEIGEWSGEKFIPLHFILQVSARKELRLYSEQILPERGRHHWDHLALATSFPFGFARKIRLLGEGGSRIVWPARTDNPNTIDKSQRGEWEQTEGELTEIQPWGDVSRVHWPSTARTGNLMARPRRMVSEMDIAHLLLDGDPAERENKIRGASRRLQCGAKTLLLHEKGSIRRIEGAWTALDTLSLLPKGDSP